MSRLLHAISALGVIVWALVCSVTSHAGEAPIMIAVQKGEDLLTALHRIHPCLDSPEVRIPSQVIEDNPEKMGRGGAMELQYSFVFVPPSFIDPEIQCSANKAAAERRRARQAAPGGAGITAGAGMTLEEIEDAQFARAAAWQSQAKNHFSLLGFAGISRTAATISTTNQKPVFNSGVEPGLEVSYFRDLSPEWSLGLDYSFKTTSEKEISNLPFVELSNSAHEFRLIADYRITGGTKFSLQLGGVQINQLNLGTGGALGLDHSLRIVGALLLWHDLGRLNGLDVWAAVGAQFFIPTNFSPSSVGVGDLMHLRFERELGTDLKLEFGIVGSFDRQQTRDDTQSEIWASFNLGVNFQFH